MLLLLCVSCTKQQQSSRVDIRCAFSADTAYSYIARQVQFGPRVPGTEEHEACGDWLAKQLAQHGAQVKQQYATMVNYAGEQQPIRNILAYLEGNTTQAILLCAHWDSRPWADEEEDYDMRFRAVPAANDGASGVGVILEIVRQLALRKAQGEYIPSVQVALFDCEDMGTPSHYTGQQRKDDWCLGSQYWAKHYPSALAEGTQAPIQYGILLDMVADPSATFPMEAFSANYAPQYLDRMWRTAHRLGYGRYFVYQQTYYPITDDHYYVNTLAGIPCIDVIDYKPNTETGFQVWWHTLQDDMQNINQQTLQAVGETVMTTICSK